MHQSFEPELKRKTVREKRIEIEALIDQIYKEAKRKTDRCEMELAKLRKECAHPLESITFHCVYEDSHRRCEECGRCW